MIIIIFADDERTFYKDGPDKNLKIINILISLFADKDYVENKRKQRNYKEMGRLGNIKNLG